MQEKTMVADTLTQINASLSNFGQMITQTANQQLRQSLIQMRNAAESSQYELYELAKNNGYYEPATAERTEIISLPESLEESMPSSTQIRLTPKSCISCKELRTSAAFLPKRESLNTSTNEISSLPCWMSLSIRWNSSRPWMFLPEKPSSEYSPTMVISSYSAYFRSLFFWASRLYPSTCMEVETLV